MSLPTYSWFVTDCADEIAEWIADNLENTTCWMGRTVFGKRSMGVDFANETDRMLFILRWT